jgi:D-3-phosphoglycerate dehydrogenase
MRTKASVRVKRVLVNAPLAEADLERLRSQVELAGIDQGDISDRIDRYLPLDALIASAVIPLNAQLLDRLPGLKVIGRLGTGVDNVDLAAATARGISVVNTPDAPTQSTAEHAVALMYALAKGLAYQDRQLRRGLWQARHERVGRELQGLAVGLVGVGRIGQRVAQLLAPLQPRLLAYDPYIGNQSPGGLAVALIESLEALLPEVDILSLHLPLNAETVRIIDRRALSLMKPTAWLINTARGGLVDETALAEALESGVIAGAGLDVFDPEPPQPGHPLFALDNVIITPHRAFYTQEGLRKLSASVVDQVLAALRGDQPAHLVNPEAWQQPSGRSP